jgi:vancomycin resistance protein VanJ
MPARFRERVRGSFLGNRLLSPPAKRKVSQIPRCLAAWGSWGILGLVVWLEYIEWSLVDAWPPATLLAFGPKWMLLLLPSILTPLAWRWHRVSLPVLGMASLIIAGPLMGFSLGRGVGTNLVSRRSTEFRLVTCNVQQRPNPGRLRNLLTAQHPHFVTLQEWPLDAALPIKGEDNWYCARDGHLVIASRFPILATRAIKSPHEPWRQIALVADIQTPEGPIQVVSLHLMTPRAGFEAVLSEGVEGEAALRVVIEQRLNESRFVREQVAAVDAPTLIAGDFNMPANSQIYAACWADYANAFSSAGFGWGHTKYTRWHGVRIDHVLGNQQWDFKRCRVGSPLGSDHRPLIADAIFFPAAHYSAAKHSSE